MKIDILAEPRTDIFEHRQRHLLLFNLFLALAGAAIALGVYAYVANPANAELLSDIALGLFAAASVPVFIVGEKLRVRRKLMPHQTKELDKLCSEYAEIKMFCLRLSLLDRHMTHAEFEACQDFAEEKKMETMQMRDTASKAQKQEDRKA